MITIHKWTVLIIGIVFFIFSFQEKGATALIFDGIALILVSLSVILNKLDQK
jgi:hypothetical protein